MVISRSLVAEWSAQDGLGRGYKSLQQHTISCITIQKEGGGCLEREEGAFRDSRKPTAGNKKESSVNLRMQPDSSKDAHSHTDKTQIECLYACIFIMLIVLSHLHNSVFHW